MSEVTFTESSGTLLAPEPVMEAFLRDGAEPAVAAAGAVVDGRLHPNLEPALRAVAGAVG